MYTIQHEQNNRNGSFFILQEDERIAHLDYTENPEGVLQLTHTYVSNVLRGQKIASKLVEACLDHARKNKLKLNPVCSYVVSWFEQHPSEKDVLASKNHD